MLQVEELSKVYVSGKIKVQALKGVSFAVTKGEFVAIMGPSGSGKSTLLHLLGCFDHPTSGRYKLNGINVAGLNDDQLAEIRNKYIGFVFQQFNLLSRATILQNVEIPLIYAGINKKRRLEIAREMLEKVGLEHRLDHLPTEISGGQRQRVAIARALAINPSLILADEPTGNLDSQTSAEIMDLFHELNNQGQTIILVTHEEDIARHAKRRIYLVDGEIRYDEVTPS
ncbi:MAG TPA: ABC transporter ATP-binding protein [Firmicutes bacterium]|jgi:putative ABC transport system ATP-binding protein|nr:ABC transporter ATP-binding protein [Bacillota bacterium]